MADTWPRPWSPPNNANRYPLCDDDSAHYVRFESLIMVIDEYDTPTPNITYKDFPINDGINDRPAHWPQQESAVPQEFLHLPRAYPMLRHTRQKTEATILPLVPLPAIQLPTIYPTQPLPMSPPLESEFGIPASENTTDAPAVATIYDSTTGINFTEHNETLPRRMDPPCPNWPYPCT